MSYLHRKIYLLVIILVSNSIIFTQEEICPDGIIGYWKLDEISGFQYQNSTGFLNPAVTNEESAPKNIQGFLGAALLFNGKTTKLDVSASPALNFEATSSFSVEFWFQLGRSRPATVKSIVGRYNPGTKARWFIGLNGSECKVRFYMTSGETAAAINGNAINDGLWHHVAATRNGINGSMKIYVDGVLRSSTNKIFTTGFSSPTASLNIGWLNFQDSYSFDGGIDEISIYNRELSVSEIELHYNNGIAGTNYCGATGFAPVFTTTPPTLATMGLTYRYYYNVIGTPEPTISLVSVPRGMGINKFSNLIYWEPIAPGSYDVVIEANNGINPPVRQSFTIDVGGEKLCPPGMISYWRMNDTIPGIYSDAVGTNNGISTSSPVLVYGTIAGAQMFNGTTSKIDIPADPSFDFPADGSFSIEFWYANRGGIKNVSQSIMGRYFPETGARWWVGVNSYDGLGRFELSDGKINIILKGISLVNGGETHVVATRNGKTGITKLYINGHLEKTLTQKLTTGFSSPTAALNIGWLNYKHGYALEGTLDEIALYNIELTDSAINDHIRFSYLYRMGYCRGGLGEAPKIISKPLKTNTVTYQDILYAMFATGEPAPKFSLIEAPENTTIENEKGYVRWSPDTPGTYNIVVEANNGIYPPDRQSFTVHADEQRGCPKSMTAYWSLDETIPGIYANHSDRNNATGDPPPVPAAGIVKGAQQFDGNTTKLKVPANPAFDFFKGNSFTIEFWFKGDVIPSTVKSAVGRNISGRGAVWYVGLNANDGKARFYMSAGGITASVNGIVLTDGRWHYVVATRNGETGISSIYVDGVLNGSFTKFFPLNFNSDDAELNIGWLNKFAGYNLNGLMDEVAIHKEVLSETDILQHYNDGLNGNDYCNLLFFPKRLVAGSDELTIIPSDYNLFQNYPNPFNPVTTIRFSLPEDQRVNIKIYNQLGEEVAELVNRNYSAGTFEVEFNGNNFCSGLYFYRMQAGEFVNIKKLILIK